MAERALAPVRVNLGNVAAVPMGQGRCFVVGNDEIAVFRQRDGRIFATPNRCPHRQGPLSEGLVGNGRVICPLHGHQFDLETGVGSETSECIPVFEVEDVNGNLMMSLDAIQC
jgi:nitrite reductase (NADH) small subunit